jgi:hypothetical protein
MITWPVIYSHMADDHMAGMMGHMAGHMAGQIANN